MGTYLYEHIDNLHFDNVEELISRLEEVLLDLGECGITEVCIWNRKAELIRLNKLSYEDEKGKTILNYNRYERTYWEPAVVSFDKKQFTGVHSQSIGSIIGGTQHYRAMLVARVLCECYSNGSYIVYGDASYGRIIGALAYIGKKYGFDLVEKFIRNRCDLNNFDALKWESDCKYQFWGTRGHAFYYRDFLAASSIENWTQDMNKSEDLKRAEQGEKVKYISSQYYLGIRLLYHMLEQDIKEMANIDEAIISSLLLRYCGRKDVKEYYSYLENLPEDLEKYGNYYNKFLESVDYVFKDIDIMQKCLSFLNPAISPIVENAKSKFLEYYMDIDKCNRANEELDIFTTLYTHEALHKSSIDEKAVRLTCEDVKEEMQKETLLGSGCFYGDSEYLNELISYTGEIPNFSQKLTNEIERIFSSVVLKGFISSWEYKERTLEDVLNKLFDITDILAEQSYNPMIEDFFYMMFYATNNQELGFRLDLLHFMLNNCLKPGEKFIVNCVIENDSLYDKYVRQKMHAYDQTLLYKARTTLGWLFHNGVYLYGISIDELYRRFLNSGIAASFEEGNPSVVAGKSGAELAFEVVSFADKSVTMLENEFTLERSREYWLGYSLAYYQWDRNISFRRIVENIELPDIVALYDKYHEMDIEHFEIEVDRLRLKNSK